MISELGYQQVRQNSDTAFAVGSRQSAVGSRQSAVGSRHKVKSIIISIYTY